MVRKPNFVFELKSSFLMIVERGGGSHIFVDRWSERSDSGRWWTRFVFSSAGPWVLGPSAHLSYLSRDTEGMSLGVVNRCT